MSDNERGMSTDPAEVMRRFGDAWATVTDPAEREEMLAVFTSLYLVSPMGDALAQLDSQGEWQARARRVINTANRLIDADVDSHHLGELRRVLVNTDFREDTPTHE